jgi:hypothetical protein
MARQGIFSAVQSAVTQGQPNTAVKMDLHIEIEFQEALLVVTARGSVAFDAALRLFRNVFDTAAENLVTGILVDALAVEGELAAFERYQLGSELGSYLAERQMNFKLALVGGPPAVTGFAVRVLQNRDIVARTFSDQREALSWLENHPG